MLGTFGPHHSAERLAMKLPRVNGLRPRGYVCLMYLDEVHAQSATKENKVNMGSGDVNAG